LSEFSRGWVLSSPSRCSRSLYTRKRGVSWRPLSLSHRGTIDVLIVVFSEVTILLALCSSLFINICPEYIAMNIGKEHSWFNAQGSHKDSSIARTSGRQDIQIIYQTWSGKRCGYEGLGFGEIERPKTSHSGLQEVL